MLIPFTSASFTNLSGLAVADGAAVEVRLELNGALAALFDDRDGTTPLTNPFNADSQGRFEFYVAGRIDGYSVEVSKGAQTHIIRHQLTTSAAGAIFDNTGTGLLAESVQDAIVEISSELDRTWYVEKSGAVGDGVTDDTVSIQAALNSGHKVVKLTPGKTYIVDFTGTKTFRSAANRYCLLVPDGVFFDLNRGTLKLAASANASILMNATAGTTQNTDIWIANGALDGNETNQTEQAAGDVALIIAYGVKLMRVWNIDAKNAKQYFGKFMLADQCFFRSLHGTRSDGDGWHFGLGGAGGSLHLTNSFIDDVYAEDCSGEFTGLEGNGFVLTSKWSQIGRVESVNVGGGNKIQDDSIDTNWAISVFRGGANSTANGGTKIQGTNGTKNCERINAGLIISEGCHSSGLFVIETKDSHVNSYIGYNNGVTGNIRDVDIQNNDRFSWGAIKVSKPAASPNVLIGATGDTGYRGGEVSVYNGVGRGVALLFGSGHINTINVFDGPDQVQTEAVHVTGSTTKGKVDFVNTNLDPDTDTTKQIVYIQGTNKDFEFGQIQFGGTGVLEGVITLSNAATSTAVATDNIWKEFTGSATTDHYFHPVIQIMPWNASAMALLASGGFRVTVNRLGTVGTGFTIHHPTSGATDKVFWKVLGWRVVAEEAA